MKENIIIPEGNLNNNQINKLNLPTTWTKQKMIILFLLTLASVKKVNSGQTFKNCLKEYYEYSDEIAVYNSLLNFDFASQPNITNGELLRLCYSYKNNNLFLCPNENGGDHRCLKIGSLIFCSRLGAACSGIIGDSPIITNTTLGGNCGKNNLTSVSEYLTARSDNILRGDRSLGVYKYDCLGDSPCSNAPYCNWDNEGWSCHSIGSNVNYSCLFQWTAPWPEQVYPSTASSTSSIINTSTTSKTTPTLPGNSSDSYSKGLDSGEIIGIISGVLTFIGICFGIYFAKKQIYYAKEQLKIGSRQLWEQIRSSERDLHRSNIELNNVK